MTTLPDVTMTVQDGSLGQVPAATGGIQVKIGVTSAGAVGVLAGYGDLTSLQSGQGYGQAVDAAAQALAVAGGPVYVLPVLPTAYGTNGTVTKLSPTSSAGTITPTVAPASQILLKIELGGVNGTMTFRYSVGGAAYSAVQPSTGGTFAFPVPGTFTTATFAAAQTWVAADVYTLATDGTVVRTGTGPASSNVTHTDSPVDAFSVAVAIITAGALGVAVFRYSLDGGNAYGGNILVPSGGVYVIPNTGIVLTFASTFGAGDLFTWSTTTATFDNTTLAAALVTLNAAAVDWGFVHVVGAAANSAGAASAAAVVDTAMTTAFTNFRFVWGMIEVPTSEADATVAAAFASFASTRVSAAAGDLSLVSPRDGRIYRRNVAWAASARLGLIPLSEEPSFTGRGSLNNVTALYRDEFKTPLLDAARFLTARSFPGLPGFFITRGRMMASPGSDFDLVSRRRVMDRACQIVRAGLLPFVNADVRVDKKTGFIDERDAQAIETIVNGKLFAGIVANGTSGDASAASVVLSRTQNILSTRTEPVTVRVIPKAIIDNYDVNIGFQNPVLTQSLALAA